MFRFYDKIIASSALPKINSVQNELKKAGLLRCILGCIMFIRYAEISYSLIIMQETSFKIGVSIAFLVLVSIFTLGLITPIATLVLLYGVFWADWVFVTYTLATDIFMMTLVALLLIDAGQFYSLDNLIVRKNKLFAKMIILLHTLVGQIQKEK